MTIVFDDSADVYTARQQVLERISKAEIPDGLEPQLDPNASPVGEVFRYVLEGRDWSAMDKKEVQDWLLNRLFKSVDGIVDSTGFGGPTKVFLVEIDPGRLKALGLSQSQVAQAISRSNDSTGGSYIVTNDQRFMVRGLGLLKSSEDLGNVVIFSRQEGVPIRVKDVASVHVSQAVRKGQVGLNGDDDVVEGILMMTRGDNPSRVITNLNEAWADIEDELPQGLKLNRLYDRTALVKKTIDTISHNVAEGVILVVVILMLFLFQIRSALVCSLVIPCALLGAAIALKVFNIPANLLSLGAIDFGIIVDGAVILIEQIAKNLTLLEDDSDEQLARCICKAVEEVGKPILFATTIIGLTFLPILSFEHVEGRLFKPLAIMMNLNLICALGTTLLVLPVICFLVFQSRKFKARENPLAFRIESFLRWILPKLQRGKAAVLSVFAIFIAASFCLVPYLGAEFIPELEEGNIWLTVTIIPPSVTLEKAVQLAGQLRSIIGEYPETGNVLTQIGSPDDGTDPNPYNLIEVLVQLKPQETWRKEFKTKEALVKALSNEIGRKMPGIICNFSQCIKDSMEEAMSGVKNGEYAVKVFGRDLKVLEELAIQIARIMRSTEGIEDVAYDLLSGQPQVVIEVEPERASRLGVTADEILDVVETAVGGKVVSKIVQGERRFDVVLRLQKVYRDDPKRVGEILVNTPQGMKVPLKQLASIKLVDGANSILRDNNKRRIAVYANIRGRDLSSAVLECQLKVKREVKLPSGYKIGYAGEFERAKEAGRRLAIVVPLTLILIFMLLYLSFDSLALSLLIMSAAPVAAAVSIYTLLLTGTHLSVSSGVGLIALFGLSIQNSVIVAARLKDLLKSGQPPEQATVLAVEGKANAVIIAAFVAAVGLLPAAYSTGIGAQSQKPFATVISLGIVPSALLTLLLMSVLGPLLLKQGMKKDIT